MVNIETVRLKLQLIKRNRKEGETLDIDIIAETVCDFLDSIDVKTYVTDFKQESATQERFNVEKENSLTLGYITDDIAEHPSFKHIGENQ